MSEEDLYRHLYYTINKLELNEFKVMDLESQLKKMQDQIATQQQAIKAKKSMNLIGGTMTHLMRQVQKQSTPMSKKQDTTA